MKIQDILFSKSALSPYTLGTLTIEGDELIFKKNKGFLGQGTRASGQLSLVLFKKLLMLPGLILSPEKELLRIQKSEITQTERAREKAGNKLAQMAAGITPDVLIIHTSRGDLPKFRLSFETADHSFDTLLQTLQK